MPVLACSSKSLTSEERALLLEFRTPFLSKDDLDPGSLAKGIIDAYAWGNETQRDEARAGIGGAR